MREDNINKPEKENNVESGQEIGLSKTDKILCGVFILAIIAIWFTLSNDINSHNSETFDEKDLRILCQIKIEDASIFGARFPIGTIKKQQFYSYKGQSDIYIKFPFELKNTFGTWGKSFATCKFPDNGKYVSSLNIDGETIY